MFQATRQSHRSCTSILAQAMSHQHSNTPSVHVIFHSNWIKSIDWCEWKRTEYRISGEESHIQFKMLVILMSGIASRRCSTHQKCFCVRHTHRSPPLKRQIDKWDMPWRWAQSKKSVKICHLFREILFQKKSDEIPVDSFSKQKKNFKLE